MSFTDDCREVETDQDILDKVGKARAIFKEVDATRARLKAMEGELALIQKHLNDLIEKGNYILANMFGRNKK